MAHANCKDADTEIFFPERGDSSSTDAKMLCLGCTVRKECKEYRRITNSSDGVWGGDLAPKKKGSD